MKRAAFFLFSAGILLAFLFNLLSVWANAEALSFDSELKAEGPLKIVCPPFITLAAPTEISTWVKNSGQDAVRRTLRFTATQGSVLYTRREETIFDLQPGEARRFTWQVSASDAAWRRFVMGRAYLFRAYPDSSQSSACGIFLIPISFLPGEGLSALWLILSAALTAWGGWRLHQRGLPADREGAFSALAALSALGILSSLMGWFALAAFSLLANFLLILIVLGRRLQGVDRG